MGLFASSILVKYSLLNNSGSLVYAGTSSNSLRIWGAQLELAEYSEDILNDYVNNYRYVRTTGQVQNFYGIRFGSGVNGDQSVDTILIGGSSGTRMNNVYAENTAFFVDKSPLRGLDPGTATTVSSAAVFTSSYTTVSSTNLLLASEDFTAGSWVTYGTVAVSSNVVLSPIGTYDADRIIFGGNASGIYQNIVARGFTDYVLSVWLRSDTPVTMGIASDTNFGQADNTSITTTSSWARYTFFRTRTLVDTNIVNFQLINYPGYATPNTGTVYAWGAQIVTSTATMAALGYPYYIRTTSSAIFNAPVSSTMNLITDVNLLDTGIWPDVSYTTTRTGIAGAAPDGSVAYLLTDTNFNADGAAIERALSITANAASIYTFSIYVKQFDINTAYVDLHAFFVGHITRGSYIRYNFGSQTVVPGIGPEGGILPFNTGVQQVGNGWARIYFSIYDNIGPNNTMLFRFYPSSRDAVRGACYAYGPQVSLYNLTTQVGPAGLTDFVRTTGTAISYFATTSVTAIVTSAGYTLTTTTSFTLSQTFSGTTTISGADHDRLFVGQQYRADTRLSGDPLERLSFAVTRKIKDTPGYAGTAVSVSDDRRRIPSNPVYDAAKVAGLELLKKTNQTFSYNRYTPVAGDNVYYNAHDWFSEVGRSQRARMAIGGDTQVNFFNKRLDEVKQIPRIAKYDAAAVMGLELVSKTSSIINLAKYTPLRSADIAYYKKWDWYSDVPRSQYAKLAYGIGDGSPYIYDNMLISGDQFVYQSTTAPFDYLTIGSSPYSPTVFSTANTSDWGTVLNTYGVWPYTDYPATSSQGTFTVYRSFTAPYTGNYGLQGAVSFFSQGDPYGLNYVAYASTGATPARPGGPVIQTGTVPNLDYDWQTGPVLDLVRFNPAPSPNDTNLVEINFTGYILWPGTSGTGTKTVTFYTYTDDGFQLSINNTLYIDNWIEQGPILYNTSMAITLNAGQVYTFNAWWYENAGGAAVRLFWNTGDGQGIRVVPNSALGTTPYSWSPSISGSKLTVSIDGSPRLYTSSTLPTFSTVSSSLVNLSAGTHILKFDVNLDNVGAISQIRPGGYAVRILNGSAAASTTSAADIVWDTRSYRAGESNIKFAHTTSVGKYNDAAENISLVDLKAAKRSVDTHIVINNRHQSTTDAGFTMDAGKFRNRSWYQLAPLYTDYSHIIDTAGAGDLVRVGDYHGGVRHSNNKQETMAIWFASKPRADITITTDTQSKLDQKTALRSSYSSTTIQTVIRTNRIAQSERLDRTNFWSTTGAVITTSTALLSPLLPYRAVGYDADQIAELFYNQPNQIYYRKWYSIVPLSTRTQSWTSNAINIINVTSSNSQHGAATLINFNIGLDNYYSYGMFVKQLTGVNRVRLYVGLPNLTTSIVDLMGGSVTYDLITDLTLPFSADLMELGSDFEVPHYADFDLVAGTVTNRLNVSYANITDRGNGWKLIKIAGPVTGTADSVTDTLPVFRDFVSIRDSLELSSALFDLAPADLLIQNGAVDLTDTGGIEELL
jgi:hypothetical protein